MEPGSRNEAPDEKTIRSGDVYSAKGLQVSVTRSNLLWTLLLIVSVLSINGAVRAQTSTPDPTMNVSGEPQNASELAKKLQNPIGDLINVPFQSNTNFNVGPHQGTQEILNIQPVIPIHITPDWNVITRTILPLIWQPSLQPAQTVPFGTGPITFSAFLTPSKLVDGWLWGIGPVVQVPTISSATLGSNVWGGGPTAVVVKTTSHIVAGALINNVWSFGGTTGIGATRYSVMTFQPFFNYNLGQGWALGTSPVITANWYAKGEQWTVPVGAQVSKLFKLGGKLPVNLLLGAYYYPIRQSFGSTWTIRSQIAFIF